MSKTLVTYETKFGTLGTGYVADHQVSPLTGKAKLLIVDSLQEILDLDAGQWIDASQCQEVNQYPNLHPQDS